eukprot:1189559-Prorocentrum_minimum.AAC.4
MDPFKGLRGCHIIVTYMSRTIALHGELSGVRYPHPPTLAPPRSGRHSELSGGVYYPIPPPPPVKRARDAGGTELGTAPGVA